MGTKAPRSESSFVIVVAGLSPGEGPGCIWRWLLVLQGYQGTLNAFLLSPQAARLPFSCCIGLRRVQFRAPRRRFGTICRDLCGPSFAYRIFFGESECVLPTRRLKTSRLWLVAPLGRT